MVEMQVFNLYPTQKIKLGDKSLIIEPYRVAEIRDYIAPMDEIQIKLAGFLEKVGPLWDKTESGELTPEEIDELKNMTREIEDLQRDTTDIAYKIAQLGLKRALYPEAYDKIGNELDKFPNVGIASSTVMKVSGIMMTLANKDMPKVADTKNELIELLQKRSGRTSKD